MAPAQQPSPDDGASVSATESDASGTESLSPGHDAAGGTRTDGTPGGDIKRPRACEACRGLKVRCERDEDNPEGACRRCWRARRSCVVTAPTRKRQKKADSRVAELEKKIDALTASLQGRAGGASVTSGGIHIPSVADIRPLRDERQPSPAAERRYPTPDMSSSILAGLKRKFTDTRDGGEDRRPPAQPQPEPAHEYPDPIDKGLISMERASEMFARYNENMAVHLPGVVFAPGTTAGSLSKVKTRGIPRRHGSGIHGRQRAAA